MAQEPKYLSQYSGTDELGNNTIIVAEDMVTAASIYKSQKDVDPQVLQVVKKQILCALPDKYTIFRTEAYDSTAEALTELCTVTPTSFRVTVGTDVIFTAIPADGFEFVEWQIDGEDVQDADGEVITDPVAMLTIPKNAGDECVVRAVFREA